MLKDEILQQFDNLEIANSLVERLSTNEQEKLKNNLKEEDYHLVVYQILDEYIAKMKDDFFDNYQLESKGISFDVNHQNEQFKISANESDYMYENINEDLEDDKEEDEDLKKNEVLVPEKKNENTEEDKKDDKQKGKGKKLIKVFVLGFLTCLFIVLGLLFYLFRDSFLGGRKYPSYISFILASVLMFIIFKVIYSDHKKKISIKEMVLVSIMSAITVVLYYFAKFKLPFFPSFLDIQVSEIPALITSFIYGPISGCLIIIIRFLIKLPASTTFFVGELADLIIGLTLIIVCSLIYKKRRTFKGAVLASLLGILVSTLVACVVNLTILIPFYMDVFGLDYAALAKMMSYIPFVNENNFLLVYLFIGVIPFNLFRYLIVFILTFLLYKNTHRLFNYIIQK